MNDMKDIPPEPFMAGRVLGKVFSLLTAALIILPLIVTDHATAMLAWAGVPLLALTVTSVYLLRRGIDRRHLRRMWMDVFSAAVFVIILLVIRQFR